MEAYLDRLLAVTVAATLGLAAWLHLARISRSSGSSGVDTSAPSLRPASEGPSAFALVFAMSLLALDAASLVGYIHAVGHSGLSAVYLAFAPIMIAACAALIACRIWLAARAHNAVSLSELVQAHYGPRGGRAALVAFALLATVVAVLFCTAQIAVLARLIAGLSNHAIPFGTIVLVLGAAMMTVVASGEVRDQIRLAPGLVAVALLGMAMLCTAVVIQTGGIEGFWLEISQVASGRSSDLIDGPDDRLQAVNPALFELGLWRPFGNGPDARFHDVALTSALVTACWIAVSPAFLSFVVRLPTPNALPAQQFGLLACTGGIGLTSLAVIAGGFAAFNLAETAPMASVAAIGAPGGTAQPGAGYDVRHATEIISWLGGSSGAIWLATLAALLSAGLGAAVLMAAGTVEAMVPRDAVRWRFAVFVTGAATFLALFSDMALAMLVGLFTALGIQLLPLVFGIALLPWMSSRGVAVGIAAGALVAIGSVFAETLRSGFAPAFTAGGALSSALHPGLFGLAANLAVVLLFHLADRVAGSRDQRTDLPAWDQITAIASDRMIMARWVVGLLWIFFAIGPGAIFGNDFAGLAAAGDWPGGIPPIVLWQSVCVLSGALLVALLAWPLPGNGDFQVLRQRLLATAPPTVKPTERVPNVEIQTPISPYAAFSRDDGLEITIRRHEA